MLFWPKVEIILVLCEGCCRAISLKSAQSGDGISAVATCTRRQIGMYACVFVCVCVCVCVCACRTRFHQYMIKVVGASGGEEQYVHEMKRILLPRGRVKIAYVRDEMERPAGARGSKCCRESGASHEITPPSWIEVI